MPCRLSGLDSADHRVKADCERLYQHYNMLLLDFLNLAHKPIGIRETVENRNTDQPQGYIKAENINVKQKGKIIKYYGY